MLSYSAPSQGESQSERKKTSKIPTQFYSFPPMFSISLAII